MHPIRIAVAICALVAAPSLLRAQREKLPPDDYDFVTKTWPEAKVSNTGIRYIVEKPGSGPLLRPGDTVKVNYKGKLFTFHLDRGEVIAGWDQIMQLMRPGSKWLVIVPPELAYGRRGYAPVIPSYATLVFDIEIVGVNPAD
jgi:FKBP-type peptidyl-prolyl cis-trans isomerase